MEEEISSPKGRVEPLHRTATVALTGVVGGLIGAWVGGRMAVASVGPAQLDSGDVWVDAIALFGNLIVALAGAVVGYVTGACVVPIAAIATLRWDSVLFTALWLIVVQLIAVPIAAAVMLGSDPVFGSGLPGVIVGAAVVGAVAPAVARTLAVKTRGSADVR